MFNMYFEKKKLGGRMIKNMYIIVLVCNIINYICTKEIEKMFCFHNKL